MNNNTVKYLLDRNFSKLNLAEDTEIKNLGRARSGFIICQLSLSRIHILVQNFYPVI